MSAISGGIIHLREGISFGAGEAEHVLASYGRMFLSKTIIPS
ncbi:hypothetical protein N8E89_19310 (plasmid) [Phyllobacterium sp. A18/5-2]|nr:hypothetical protein [Phyllobacterium sp. A18/5-2]UXN66758.1 hypothetical protein N8E89_19310 [Phyllobacterium sp. A18/5-2]